MASGDPSDIFGRIKALIPRWFSDSTPVLDALLRGFAYAKSFVFELIGYAGLQMRIKTATDGWLDMIAADFFGAALARKPGQSDATYRRSILINMFRERATRAGLARVLTELTGRAPAIFEPLRPFDTGSYGGPLIGYGVAGGYGSMVLPYLCFVRLNLPFEPIPMLGGYNSPCWGYGIAPPSGPIPHDGAYGGPLIGYGAAGGYATRRSPPGGYGNGAYGAGLAQDDLFLSCLDAIEMTKPVATTVLVEKR